MSQTITIQSNFTYGEIDGRVDSRFDLDVLSKGVKYARNVLVVPQGGLKRRFGTKYLYDGLLMDDKTEGRIAIFEYSDETKYLLFFEHLQIIIFHNDLIVDTIVSPYTKAQMPDIKFAQGSDEFFVVHPDVAPYVLIRVSDLHTSWSISEIDFTFFPTYDFDKDYDGVTFRPSAVTGDITLTATTGGPAGPFKASHVGGLFDSNDGIMRITVYNSDTEVEGYTIDKFKNDDYIDGRLSILKEPVWSASLGYPRCATFFQGRLCFGGSSSVPQGVWMSKTNDLNNFDDSEAFATNAVEIFVHTNNSNIVKDMIGEKTLLVFTSTGLVATQVMNEAAITVTNVSFGLQNNDGIGSVRPQIFDNKVVYMDKGGKILWGMTYDSKSAGQAASDISILSQSLLNDPVSMATYRNPDDDNGNYLIVVNGDGTLAILQSVNEQGVLGWTKCMTDPAADVLEAPEKGMYRHVAAAGSTVYFIVEREIDGLSSFYIEKIDFDLYTDSTIVRTYDPATTDIVGISHLEGEAVKVIGDGLLQTDKTVTLGAITLDKAATEVKIGLSYRPLIVPLPVSVAVEKDGNNKYRSKRIKTLWVDYFESLGIYADDQLIPFITLNESQFDVALPLETDFYSVTPMHGWDPRAEIEITQYDPYPMLIKSIGMEIEI